MTRDEYIQHLRDREAVEVELLEEDWAGRIAPASWEVRDPDTGEWEIRSGSGGMVPGYRDEIRARIAVIRALRFSIALDVVPRVIEVSDGS